MYIVVVGLNNKTAPVAIREQFSFGEQEIVDAMVALREEKSIFESVILSTCNRTELYVVTDQLHTGRYYTKRFLANWFNLEMEQFTPYLSIREGEEAIRHLFRVTSGLDSMIIGETQILGQVKTSFFRAQEHGTTGTVFNKLFKEAVTLAKRAHTDTKIGEMSVSVSSAAVTLAQEMYQQLEDKQVVVVGAGETGELTTLNLFEAGAKQIAVFNRTESKAKAVADKFKGRAHSIREIACGLLDADILISSTGAKEAVIGYDDVAAAQLLRRERPLLLIDIAVPRDIDPAVATLPGVHLFDVDDLNGIVNKNLEARLVEAEKIEMKIDEAIQEFQTWLITLGVVPIMNELRARALDIQEDTMTSLERKLDHLSARDKKVIGKHMKSIINQILRDPIDYIKDAAAQPDANVRIAQFIETFGLDVELPERPVDEVEETDATSAKAPLRALMR